MLAIGLDTARNVAIVVVVVLVVGAVASAWLMKTIVQKVAVSLVLLLLAFSVYTQRSAMQDCADQVKANLDRTDVQRATAECSFFGVDVSISDPRDAAV